MWQTILQLLMSKAASGGEGAGKAALVSGLMGGGASGAVDGGGANAVSGGLMNNVPEAAVPTTIPPDVQSGLVPEVAKAAPAKNYNPFAKEGGGFDPWALFKPYREAKMAGQKLQSQDRYSDSRMKIAETGVNKAKWTKYIGMMDGKNPHGTIDAGLKGATGMLKGGWLGATPEDAEMLANADTGSKAFGTLQKHFTRIGEAMQKNPDDKGYLSFQDGRDQLRSAWDEVKDDMGLYGANAEKAFKGSYDYHSKRQEQNQKAASALTEGDIIKRTLPSGEVVEGTVINGKFVRSRAPQAPARPMDKKGAMTATRKSIGDNIDASVNAETLEDPTGVQSMLHTEWARRVAEAEASDVPIVWEDLVMSFQSDLENIIEQYSKKDVTTAVTEGGMIRITN